MAEKKPKPSESGKNHGQRPREESHVKKSRSRRGRVAHEEEPQPQGKNHGNESTKKNPYFVEDGYRSELRMKKLIRKRARDYNSDSDSGHPDDDVKDRDKENDSDDCKSRKEDITKFVEGCRAFRVAFKSIVSSKSHDPLLGPVMSAQKQLLAEKLAQEQALSSLKCHQTNHKRLISAIGHLQPDTFLTSHDKFLIGIATKGVVKLFNAVNKAQQAQKGLNPARSKDEKAIKKRRKEAFFSELRKTKSAAANKETVVEAAWAPLSDNYMVATSKFKDWNKRPPPEQERPVTYHHSERRALDDGSSSEED